MAINIDINRTTHRFDKQNKSTQMDREGMFDTLKCELCGLTGKRRGLVDFVTIYGRTKATVNCPNATAKVPEPTQIKIKYCDGPEDIFANITPGSKHLVIETPDHALKDPDGDGTERGYWVMGKGQPVLVLFEECEVING